MQDLRALFLRWSFPCPCNDLFQYIDQINSGRADHLYGHPVDHLCGHPGGHDRGHICMADTEDIHGVCVPERRNQKYQA